MKELVNKNGIGVLNADSNHEVTIMNSVLSDFFIDNHAK